MSYFSEMNGFCNVCGKPYLWSAGLPFLKDRGNKTVCSIDCLREHDWREHLSIMGLEYRPKKVEEQPK